MKALTINVQITKCPRQYESVRLGGEWSVDKGETVEEVLTKATELLNKYYVESQQPKVQPQAQAQAQAQEQPKPTTAEQPQPVEFEKPKQKQKLTMADSKTVTAICKRMQAGVKLEKVLEYYEPDEEVRKVLELAGAVSE